MLQVTILSGFALGVRGRGERTLQWLYGLRRRLTIREPAARERISTTAEPGGDAVSFFVPDGRDDLLPDAGEAPFALAQARRQMVEVQLPRHGVVEPRVLAAMAAVPREQFVPAALRGSAYIDSSLPIGLEQTISQPAVTALMCELAQLEGNQRVLEIGAGSGYGAAVLSRLAAEVVTVERLPLLAERARRRLRRLGFANVTVQWADGTLGWPAAAPYDAIVVTAGAAELPPALLEQLAPGGRLVAPLGPQPRDLTMYRFTNAADGLRVDEHGSFAFVPLVSDAGSGL